MRAQKEGNKLKVLKISQKMVERRMWANGQRQKRKQTQKKISREKGGAASREEKIQKISGESGKENFKNKARSRYNYLF